MIDQLVITINAYIRQAASYFENQQYSKCELKYKALINLIELYNDQLVANDYNIALVYNIACQLLSSLYYRYSECHTSIEEKFQCSQLGVHYAKRVRNPVNNPLYYSTYALLCYNMALCYQTVGDAAHMKEYTLGATRSLMILKLYSTDKECHDIKSLLVFIKNSFSLFSMPNTIAESGSSNVTCNRYVKC